MSDEDVDAGAGEVQYKECDAPEYHVGHVWRAGDMLLYWCSGIRDWELEDDGS